MHRHGKKNEQDEAPDWAEPEASKGGRSKGARVPNIILPPDAELALKRIKDKSPDLYGSLLGLMRASEANQTREEAERISQDESGTHEARAITSVLTAAGYGASAIERAAALADNPPEKLRAWASQYKGSGTPWMICEGDAARASAAAAWAVYAVTLKRESEGRLIRPIRVAARDFCGEIRAAQKYGPDNRDERLRHYAEAGLLVLDALGEEEPDRPSIDAFSYVVARREEYRRPTILTTETSIGAWAHRYETNCSKADDYQLVRRTATAIKTALASWESLDTTEAREALARNVIKFTC